MRGTTASQRRLTPATAAPPPPAIAPGEKAAPLADDAPLNFSAAALIATHSCLSCSTREARILLIYARFFSSGYEMISETNIWAGILRLLVSDRLRLSGVAAGDGDDEADRGQPRRERGDFVVHEAGRESRPLHFGPGEGEGELLHERLLGQDGPEGAGRGQAFLEPAEEGRQ